MYQWDFIVVILVLIFPPVYVCWQVTGDRAKQPQLIQHRLAQLAPPAMTKGDLSKVKGLNWLFIAGKRTSRDAHRWHHLQCILGS